MARVRRKLCFCTSCGKENHVRYKKCKHCKKNLHEKNHLLRDYMLDNIKDKFKDKVTNKLVSIIKAYLYSHIYGTMLVATVLITAATVVFNTVSNTVEIKKIETRPTLLSNSLSICDNSIKPKLICEGGLNFNENNMCVRITTVDAKTSKVCEDGYHLNNNKCISDKTYTKNTEKKCLKPTTMPSFISSWDQYESMDDSTGVCVMTFCNVGARNDDGTCSAGSADEVDYTIITSCSEGSLINDECHKTKSTITKYICEDGTLKGKKCNIESEEEPTITCEDGYKYNEDCNACVEVE